MNEKQKDAQEWDSCPAGEMRRLVADLRSTRRTRKVKMIAGISASAILLLLAGNLVISFTKAPQIAGLSCRQVEAYAQDYVANKLEPEVSAQVTRHTEHCGRCRRMIAELKKQRAKDHVATDEQNRREQRGFAMTVVAANH